MTTAVPVHQHHRFSHPIAMAAATVVVVGGATAIGVAVSQNDATAPSAPAPAPHACQVTACLPSDIGKDPLGMTHGRHLSPPPKAPGLNSPGLKGGHVVDGLP